MNYIETKLKEFKELKIIDGQEADGIIDENTRISDWIEKSLTEAYNQGKSDYHNHIVEKIGIGDKGMYRSHLDCPNEGDMYAGIGYREAKEDILKILQDTNPKEL